MRKLNCLIVEDEPLAAEGLEDYLRQVPSLHYAGACRNALEALEVLNTQKIDLLFLDIHLPGLKGLEFLRTLNRPPQVVVTTAYQHYALEGYELNVVDYLLKPFSFARFLAAVNKVVLPETVEAAERSYHFFLENKRRVKVYHDEIVYVESLKEYVKIVMIHGGQVVTRFQIGELEQFLNDPNLLRIHRSFLVAKDKITAFSATEIEAGRHVLPIGKNYRDIVAGLMK